MSGPFYFFLVSQGNIIAFNALLSNGLYNIPVHTIIKFKEVTLNEGNGYDPNTGKFTAPVDGVYYFAWTYCSLRNSDAYLCGYVDGKLTARIALKGQHVHWQNTSGHLVTKLKKGQKFWIAVHGYPVKNLYPRFTFLSGYKLPG